MSLIIIIIIVNYIVLILDTIYNKSNMVVKNSLAQLEDWFGNSNRNHKSIKQKGNPQLEDWTSKIKNLNDHCWIERHNYTFAEVINNLL